MTTVHITNVAAKSSMAVIGNSRPFILTFKRSLMALAYLVSYTADQELLRGLNQSTVASQKRTMPLNW